jgi:hypothetical protein
MAHFIPADFRPKAKELFDPEEMKRLFDRGYQDAVKGTRGIKLLRRELNLRNRILNNRRDEKGGRNEVKSDHRSGFSCLIHFRGDGGI